MYVDVLKLKDWYHSSTGHTVRRMVQGYLDELWPDLAGLSVLVVGYGLPYIDLWQKQAEISVLMPARMGVIHWPEGEKNITCMAWENQMPFAGSEFDRILVVHGMEFTGQPRSLLDECWRVLKADGELVSVVPNRVGVWARREISPFARGQPFSGGQMDRLLRRSGFKVEDNFSAVFMPPAENDFVLAWAKAFEDIGSYLRLPLGGLIISCARKDAYSGRVVRVKTQRAPLVKVATKPASFNRRF